MSRRFSTVLFDVDGTLVDSTYAHTIAWWQAFRREQLDVPMWRIHRAIGMGADQLIPHVTDNAADLDSSALAESHDAIYSLYWPALRTLPKARELIKRCHDKGLTTVLASSAGPREVHVVRELLGADDAIDHVTTAEDAESSKPSPDLVLRALQLSGTDAATAVFIGDSVWDVHACRQAGVACIGLECGGTSAAELQTAGACAVFADPADLLANWSDSPLATTAQPETQVLRSKP